MSPFLQEPVLRQSFQVAATRLLVLLAALLAPHAGLRAQTRAGSGDVGSRPTYMDPATAPRPSLAAHRTEEPVRVDGRLDERAWALADSATGFVLAIPRAGYPPAERTVVRVLYGKDHLYIGAWLYDTDARHLTVPSLEQDFQTHDSDIFGLSLDTYWDKQNAYLFAVNPGGGLFDAQVFNDSRYVNSAWEGEVAVGTETHDWGWSAELAIPFTALRFRRRAEQTWGVNFVRRVRRQNEDAYWAPLDRQQRVHKMSRAGTLTGLRDLRQGRNLTVKPYASAARSELAADLGESTNDADAGFDVKYGITPRLTLDVTALTDFSQVEVDQEQVNLTRFSLFFPEKRDFFMENDGVFTLGDVNERDYRMGSSLREFKLFHSRRIGLSDDRQPLPIALGGRMTGRLGGLELGLLNMQTQASDAAPAENFGVVRLRHGIFGNGDVGVMFINRQGTSDGATDSYNRSYGIDANFRPLRYMVVNSYLTATDEPGVSGNRAASRIQVAWRDPVWNVSAMAKQVGDAFNPGVGFVSRRAMRQLFTTFGAHPQPRLPGVIEVNPYVDLNLISDLDWRLESRSVLAGLGLTFLDGGTLSLEYDDRFERLATPDDIAGVEVAAGDYGFADGAVSYRSSGGRWISGSVRFSHGGFYDGSRTSIAASTLLRPSHHVSLDLAAEHNALTLAGSATDADVFSGRVRYAQSTKLFVSAFVQYNTSSSELVTNLRFNFIHAPLSDVFLVYTERRDLDLGVLIDRVVTAKVTKLIAF